jgi:hypothetical protein
MPTTVWAFQPLDELKNETGFVECDDALAVQLIASGRAQDPQVGALAMNHIIEKPAPAPREEQTYDDKAMTPKRRGK